jgi:ATP-dependent DNA helicase RecG
MNNEINIIRAFEEFLLLPHETEWIEFKENNCKPDEIGEYISALSNAASLHNKPFGYLIFGVEDSSLKVSGTKFKPRKKSRQSRKYAKYIPFGA